MAASAPLARKWSPATASSEQGRGRMGAGPSLRSPRRLGLDRPGPTRLAGIFAPPWPHATSTAMAARSSGSGDRGAARSAWSRGGVLSFMSV